MSDRGSKFDKWAKNVKEKADFTCQLCFKTGVYLEAHHLNAWLSFPDQRYDLRNGKCLCKRCHDLFHEKYGKGENTKEQFEEFEKIFKTFVKIAKEKMN
jgi:predicted restriction endonuclease